mmetsp:Transcript_11422/g.17319  ORF Transcript_11422/g.17319 Transcript_11422/m.17319 type:complete len:146 (-) Transcript_11422:87-524(-)
MLPTPPLFQQIQHTEATRRIPKSTSNANKKPPHSFMRVGMPFLLFVAGGTYFLSIALDDRLKDKEQMRELGGSKSDRQFQMEQEKENLLRKLQKDIETKEFDNTRRIERPEEVLARRKKEREERNRWYKRTWRWITGGENRPTTF